MHGPYYEHNRIMQEQQMATHCALQSRWYHTINTERHKNTFTVPKL